MGGFLGLLLGASVLTVCEIFDFILVNSGAWLQGRRRPNQDKEKEGEDQKI